MKKHHILIIGGFCYLVLFLIIGLIVTNNAFGLAKWGAETRLARPHNLVIGITLILQSFVVFIVAIWYAVKTRVKDD